jgi:hypothetical protein
MQARIYRIHHLSEMDSVEAGNGGGRQSVGEFVRQWGPYVLTALIVPGGIAIALLLLFRRWNQLRQAVPVRASFSVNRP